MFATAVHIMHIYIYIYMSSMNVYMYAHTCMHTAMLMCARHHSAFLSLAVAAPSASADTHTQTYTYMNAWTKACVSSHDASHHSLAVQCLRPFRRPPQVLLYALWREVLLIAPRLSSQIPTLHLHVFNDVCMCLYIYIYIYIYKHMHVHLWIRVSVYIMGEHVSAPKAK